MKQIISYSLWGNNDIYYDGIFYNYSLIRKLLPDFSMRIYVDSNYPINKLHKIEEFNIEVLPIISLGKNHGMFWRFFAFEDNDVVLIRDLDSRISERECGLVKEWLESDKSLHIIRDNFWHKMPIMGGMWGGRNILKNIKSLVNDYGKFEKYGDDQEFLQIVFSMFKEDCIEHSSNGLLLTSNGIAIKKDINGYFMGERVYGDNTPVYPQDRALYLTN